MRARVNGVERDLADGATVADVLAALGVPAAGVAVAMNGAVVPRGTYRHTIVDDGAVLEVLTAVQGG